MPFDLPSTPPRLTHWRGVLPLACYRAAFADYANAAETLALRRVTSVCHTRRGSAARPTRTPRRRAEARP